MRSKTWLTRLTMITALGFVGASCGSSTPAVRMVSTADIPAAQGRVTASKTSNGNTALVVEVRHLALPERVQAGATTYVVWARAPGGIEQNLGALRVDSDLRGTLRTVTPLRSFDVFITAEPSPTAMRPSNRTLLSASIEPR